MPYKVFVAGSEALAADVNTYLMSQAVARFPSAAARTSAISAPTLNQLTVLDTRPGVIEYWTGSVWKDLVPLVMHGPPRVVTLDGNGNTVFSFPRATRSASTTAVQVQNTQAGAYWFFNIPTVNLTTTNALLQSINSAGGLMPNGIVAFSFVVVGEYP
jgi:hypothetical protein